MKPTRLRTEQYGDPLTAREELAVQLLFDGVRPRLAAQATGLRHWRQFYYHLKGACIKLGAESPLDLVAKAYREGGFNLWAEPFGGC
jgi:hypothetical protein